MPRKSKAANGSKHSLGDDFIPLNGADERPSKKAKLLDDTDEEDGSGDESGGVALKVNEEYAKRFEYNKKRAEKHRRKLILPIQIQRAEAHCRSGREVWERFRRI
jgi:protein KRI1